MSTAVSPDTLRDRLQQKLSPTELTIEDDSAAHAGHAGARHGGHYRVRIVSEAFSGLGTIARHRLVYEAVGELMHQGVHALMIDAKPPLAAPLSTPQKKATS